MSDAGAFMEEMRTGPADRQLVVSGHAVGCVAEVDEDLPDCRYGARTAR